MTYTLYIGDRTFSSWSLRGWLMFEKFDLPFKSKMVGLYGGTMAKDLAHLAPARTVPAMQTPEGHVLTDSLAMAETLHEAHPQAGLYPADAGARALARSMVAEMHSGFSALRGDCAMNLSHVWKGFSPSADVLRDLERISELWSLARERHGADGPWLFGAYSLADVFYAPAVCRIVGYDLPVSDTLRAYIDTVMDDPALRRWRAMGQTKSYDPMPYQMDLEHRDWPIKDLTSAKLVESGTPENDACPYSDLPVTHLLDVGGRIFGFCNPFCREKTMHDPSAWPAFMALLSLR